MKKLEKYTTVEIDSGVFIYIRNNFFRKYQALKDDVWIVDGRTGERYKEVILYEQIYGENGELLKTPIRDQDEYYFLYDDGKIEQCREVFGYEVRL